MLICPLYILIDIEHISLGDGDGEMKKILVSLPRGIFKLICELKGEMGESYSEVVRNIVIAYLSEQGYFSRMGAIRGIPSTIEKGESSKQEERQD